MDHESADEKRIDAVPGSMKEKDKNEKVPLIMSTSPHASVTIAPISGMRSVDCSSGNKLYNILASSYERSTSLQSVRNMRSRTMVVIGLIVFLSACTTKPKQWDAPPEMSIDPAKTYLATIKTEKGDIKVELFAEKVPKTVNNFIFLAREGYYDDITFHRVIPGFMAQSGDPTGIGGGGPGYTFEDEIDPSLTFDEAGILAMANKGPQTKTNGSQFFITYVPAEYLNGGYSIFGKLIEGMDVLESLTPRDPDEFPDYEGDRLITIQIEEIP
jgi:cyclophilin family peptidyl-prolyl cis-trans isomerase